MSLDFLLKLDYIPWENNSYYIIIIIFCNMARKNPEKGAILVKNTIQKSADRVCHTARGPQTRAARATRAAVAGTLLGTLVLGAGCVSSSRKPLHKIADRTTEASDDHPHGHAGSHAEDLHAHGCMVIGQGSYQTPHGKEGYGVAEQHAGISGPLGTAGILHWVAAMEALEQNPESGPGEKPHSPLKPLTRYEAGGRVGVGVTTEHLDLSTEFGILGQKMGGIEDEHGRVKNRARILGTNVTELELRILGSHLPVIPIAPLRSWISQGGGDKTNQIWTESSAGVRVTDEVLPQVMNVDITGGFDFRREEAGQLRESVRTLIAGARIDLFDALSVAIEGGRVLGGYSRAGHERTRYKSGWAARVGLKLDVSNAVEIIADEFKSKR